MQTTPTQYYYWRNNGDGSWGAPFAGAPISEQTIVFSDSHVRLADMNGDRLIDLVYVRAGAINYWPNRGWGRWDSLVSIAGAPDAGADQARVQLADMNGDGLTDAWLASGTELRIWLQRGDGRLASPVAFSGLPDANPLTTFVRVADMNGSGTADVVWNDTHADADHAWRYLDLTGGVRPNLLSTIGNGMGRNISIAYSSSGEMFRMAAAAGRPWTTRLPVATQVVASATTSDGRGWSKQEAFVYASGYFDAATRQFRGFGETKRIEPGNDEEATSIQVHRFDVGVTAEALKGAEVGLEVQTATGTVLRRETSGYDVHVFGTGSDGRSVTGADRRFHVTEHVEGTTTPITTRQEWTYDDYGSVRVHSEWGVVDGDDFLAGSDERITTTDYAHDTDRWLLARPVRVAGDGRARQARHRIAHLLRRRSVRRPAIRNARHPRPADPDRVLGRRRPLREHGPRPVRRARSGDGDARSARLPPRGRLRSGDPSLPGGRAPAAREREGARFHSGIRPGRGPGELVRRPVGGPDDLRLHAAPAAGLDRETRRQRREADARLRVPVRRPDVRW